MSDQWGGADRRRYPRLVIKNLNVRYKVGPGTHWEKAECGNISEGGILLITDEPVPEGDLLTIELRFPEVQDSPPPLVVQGKVIWSKGSRDFSFLDFGHGIEFVEISLPDRELLHQLLSRYTTGSPSA